MEYGKNSFRDRGVSFVLDSEGRIVSIRGYSKHLERIEVKSTRLGAALKAHSFDEAARCLGFKSADDLAEQLRIKGLNLTEAARTERSVLGGLRLASF
jgi:hypothetical protein